jgi:hypothetical protein
VIFIAFLTGAFHLEKIFIISVYGKITSQFSDQFTVHVMNPGFDVP